MVTGEQSSGTGAERRSGEADRIREDRHQAAARP